jgi:hypothetical protein
MMHNEKGASQTKLCFLDSEKVLYNEKVLSNEGCFLKLQKLFPTKKIATLNFDPADFFNLTKRPRDYFLAVGT